MGEQHVTLAWPLGVGMKTKSSFNFLDIAKIFDQMHADV
jgi:hypothetical protein